MSPFMLIMVSCLLQCMITSIASMFCPPKTDENGTCMSSNLAGVSNCIICIVVILMLANVIPMPGSKGVAIETTE